MAIFAWTLARIKSDPLACAGGAEHVNELFARSGHVWRKCFWDPARTLGVFIIQVLNGNAAIAELRHLTGIDIKDSTYCDARLRLPVSGVAHVVESVCGEYGKNNEASRSWRGHQVFLVDATSATTPDEPAMQKLWPQPSAQKPGCGFPVVKLLGVLDLITGMIVHLSLMCMNVHEMSQVSALATVLKAGDVMLADRGFCSFWHVAMLAKRSIKAVFRMHQRQIVDFTPNRPHRGAKCNGKNKGRQKPGVPTSRWVRRLGHEDHLVDWVRYPKREIASLYGLRWEIETNFRHLKTTMKMDLLKCQTPDGIVRELMVFVLVYNLIRAAMVLAAKRQDVEVDRISFVDAQRWLCSLLRRPPLEGPIELKVNPLREGRWEPRVLKRRIKPYDLMNQPRDEYPEPSPAEDVAA